MPLFGPPNVEKLKAQRNTMGLTKTLGYTKDAKVQRQAAEALGEIGDARAVVPLVVALQDEDRFVRVAAAGALGKVGDTRAVEALVAALQDHAARVAAAKALGEIGDARAVEPLVAALQEKNWARSIAEFKVTMEAALNDESSLVREIAAKKLGEIGDARAVEERVARLNNEDRPVREAAAGALGQIGDAHAIEALIKAARNDSEISVCQAAAAALMRIGTSTIDPLMVAFKAGDWNVRGAAASALVQIGKPAVEPLVAALKDMNKYVQIAAIQALGQIGDASAVKPLVAALKDVDYDVRRVAIQALGQIGKSAVEPLITALNAESDSVREAAAEALGQIGDASAVGPLVATLKDFNLRIAPIAEVMSMQVILYRDADDQMFKAVSDTTRAATGITALQRILTHAAAAIEPEDLYAVTHLDNVVAIIACTTDCGTNYMTQSTVDYSHLKQLARQELLRRGIKA